MLQNYVIPKAACKWHEMSMQLYKDAGVTHLDTIRKQCPGDFTKVHCQKTYGNATWDNLIEPLRPQGLRLNSIALDFMEAGLLKIC